MQRAFGYSQKKLTEKAEILLTVCKRDLKSLTSQGFLNGDTLYEMEKLLTKFKDYTPDRENLKEINNLNLRCKELKKQIIKTIRIIQCRLSALGHNEDEYFKMLKNLKVHNVSNTTFTDEIRKIQALSPNFYRLGIPASITGGLNGFISEYKKTLSLYNSQTATRKDKSNERISIANNLTEIVSEICKIGKLMFKGTEKYKDYLMY
ncbi:MAG: hypothetical protein II956_11685 [Bacteroidales bacterium]|nr:hypothetical protein [Bacteroidales bacterium]